MFTVLVPLIGFEDSTEIEVSFPDCLCKAFVDKLVFIDGDVLNHIQEGDDEEDEEDEEYWASRAEEYANGVNHKEEEDYCGDEPEDSHQTSTDVASADLPPTAT
jgi:hypothetical protein